MGVLEGQSPEGEVVEVSHILTAVDLGGAHKSTRLRVDEARGTRGKRRQGTLLERPGES